MEEIKKIVDSKKTKEIREPRSIWKKLFKNPLLLKVSLIFNLILFLSLTVGVPFIVYPYLGKKFLNYGQQATSEIFKRLYKKNLSRIEFDIIQNNDIQSRVLFNQRTLEKYKIKILSDWELDQDDIKQAIRILATNQVTFNQIKKWIALRPSWPVMGKFSSRMGYRLDPVAQFVGGDPTVGYHRGLDIVVKTGTPVSPFLDGTVINTGVDLGEAIGKYVAVDHGEGLISYYGHLSIIKVKKGQIVSKSDIIALSGNTGSRTTGDHLHFQINLNGQPINPEHFFNGRITFI